MDLVRVYIDKRTQELNEMIDLYYESGSEPPIDLLGRRAELERLEDKLEEYEYVEKAND
jgi:hypothetical protein